MPGNCQITHRLHAFFSFFQAKYALEKQSQDGVINKKNSVSTKIYICNLINTPHWVIYLFGKKMFVSFISCFKDTVLYLLLNSP